MAGDPMIRPDGTLGCWGNNSDGQAGERPGYFNEIGAGERFTCARDGHGSVQCWGDNSEQQLQVPQEPLRGISAGRAHVCALKSIGGETVCWGWNSNGQLGDGTTMNETHTPMTVLFP